MVEVPYLLSFVGYVSQRADISSVRSIGYFLPVTFMFEFEPLRQLCSGLGNGIDFHLLNLRTDHNFYPWSSIWILRSCMASTHFIPSQPIPVE